MKITRKLTALLRLKAWVIAYLDGEEHEYLAKRGWSPFAKYNSDGELYAVCMDHLYFDPVYKPGYISVPDHAAAMRMELTVIRMILFPKRTKTKKESK